MENKQPGPAKGYQKQIKKDETAAKPPSKTKKINPSYSSPTAKKWARFIEAVESGNADVAKRLLEEGINVNLSRGGSTPLMIAASKGHVEIAEAIVQAGVNVNAKSDENWTALHKAAFDQAETGIVDLLLQSGVDIEARNKSGKTALQLAEEKGHREIVRIIKKQQERLQTDAREWEEFLGSAEGRPYKKKRLHEKLATYARLWWLPPLVLGGAGLLPGFVFGVVIPAGIIGLAAGLLIGLSVFSWERKIQNYLDNVGPLPDLDIHTLRLKRQAGEPITIENNAEESRAGDMIDVPSEDDATAGQEADNASIGEQEFSKTPSPKKDVKLRLIAYASGALLFIILTGVIIINQGTLVEWYYTKKLGSRGIPFSEQAFLAEVTKNNEEAVELFIKAGVNREAVNDKGQTALMIASEKGYAGMLGKLGKQSPAAFNRIDANGDTALMVAARQGQVEAVNALIAGGADVNYTVPSRDGAATALQAALDASDFKDGQAKVIQYLLQRGADAKGRNAAGRSPLSFAADHGHTEAAGVLIDHGAEVNGADLKGNFALLAAACKGYSGLVALLADKGANMKMALPDGQTPLMCAARGGHGDAVRVLLEKGAAVNAKSASGSTALADAAGAGKVDMVKMLLAQGADPGSGSVPDSFRNLRGRAVAISARKSTLGDTLGRIAKTASHDGYTITTDTAMTRTITLKAKAPWNKVLHELAAKNHLFLVVRDKEIFIVPYDPAAVKRGSM